MTWQHYAPPICPLALHYTSICIFLNVVRLFNIHLCVFFAKSQYSPYTYLCTNMNRIIDTSIRDFFKTVNEIENWPESREDYLYVH